jgi:aryl-alcohol dehydrogenase-like predicted oxidoreductase
MGYWRIAEHAGRSLSQLALQFVLGLDGIAVTLLGMRTDEHVLANVRDLVVPPLGQEVMHALRDCSDAGRATARPCC